MADKHGFVDYYEILQVSSNAEPETIQRVYRLLALRYHPDNGETGDADAFKQVLEAYKVLSEPELRAAYDLEYRTTRKLWWKIFEKPEAARGVEAEKRKRHGILSLLYAKRLHQPEEAGMMMREIEDLLGCPREHLEFSLWYLRESQYIQRGDNGRWVITLKGVEMAEQQGDIRPNESRLLPAPEEPKVQNSQTWPVDNSTKPM